MDPAPKLSQRHAPPRYWNMPTANVAIAAAVFAVALRIFTLHGQWALVLRPEYKVWQFLSATQVAFCVLLSLSLWTSVRRVCRRRPARELLLLSVASVALCLLFFGLAAYVFPVAQLYHGAKTPLEPLLAGHRKVAGLLMFSLVVVGMPASFALNIVQLKFNTLRLDADTVDSFLQYRHEIRTFLTMPAFAITLGTLGVGAWHKAVVETDPALAVAFGPQFVLLFGLLWSILIMLAYYPAHLTLMAAGRRICDHMMPRPEHFTQSWLNDRRALESYLELSFTSPDNLKMSLSTLAPFLGGLLSLVIGATK